VLHHACNIIVARYTIDGLPLGCPHAADVLLCVTDMIRSRAFPGSRGQPWPPEDSHGTVIKFLEDQGLVSADEEPVLDGTVAYRLTPMAMERLISGHRLQSPSAVCKPRLHLPIEERTTFELIRHMSELGWEWQAWQTDVARRARLGLPDGYRPGEPKRWFTSGHTVSHSYLLVLLKAEDMHLSQAR
jgi:hypothetical protein